MDDVAPQEHPQERVDENEEAGPDSPPRAESPPLPEPRPSLSLASPVLPEIPLNLTSDLELDLDSILEPSNPPPTTEKVQKRASSVMKLTQENEKLKAELKAMTDRLEAAERRRLALARKEQHIMEPPSS
uniref:Uncharacterized protein n=1 Tax=Mycena chlorophos TaxID=658473 RepID=A0ABQ0M798_MYCCL|nr:predicted protein [Mycena chlorophos]